MKFLADSRLRRLATAVVLAGLAAGAQAAPSIRSHVVEVHVEPVTAAVTVRDHMTIERDGGGILRFELDPNLAIHTATLDGRDVDVLRSEDGAGRWRVEIPAGAMPTAALVLGASGNTGMNVGGGWESVRPLAAFDGGAATYDILLRASAPNVGVTCGDFVDDGDGGGGESSRWRSRTPLSAPPTIVVGPFRTATRIVRGVRLRTYLTPKTSTHADDLLNVLERAVVACTDALGDLPANRFDLVDRGALGFERRAGFVAVGAAALGAPTDGAALPDPVITRALVRTWWGDAVRSREGVDGWLPGLVEYCVGHLVPERDADTGPAWRRRACQGISGAAGEPARAALVFHAVRRELGDDTFRAALVQVLRDHAGTRIGWGEWRAAFESVSGRNLEAFFEQWLDRPGAPHLLLGDVAVETLGGRTRVTGKVLQDLGPTELPWRLSVPVVVDMVDGSETTEVLMDGEDARFSLLVPSLPLRVSVDPDHHVLRRLSPAELPGEDGAPGVSLTSKRVLPDLKGSADPERVQRMLTSVYRESISAVSSLSVTDGDLRKRVEGLLRESGANVQSRAFQFVLRHSDERSELSDASGPVDGALPLVASPATPDEGVTVTGLAFDPSDDLTGRALVMDLPATSEHPLDLLRGIAALARSGGAVALLVRAPDDASSAVLERLCATPEHPRWTGQNAILGAARLAAEGGYDERLALPAFSVPRGAELQAPLRVRVAWKDEVIESANVVARFDGTGARGEAPILLGAPLANVARFSAGDHTLPGDGDAAGLGALIEAAYILATHQPLLSRDVVLVAFGAEELGHRGSRAFLRSLGNENTRSPPPAAALLVGGVGDGTRVDVALLGGAERPRLARIGRVALEEASLDAGDEIATPDDGSARGVFGAEGVACVTLWSGEASSSAEVEGVGLLGDPRKTARVARALALAALALSAGY